MIKHNKPFKGIDGGAYRNCYEMNDWIFVNKIEGTCRATEDCILGVKSAVHYYS